MAQTPTQGSAQFPVTENEAYTAIETIAKQEIRNVKSVNRIIDGLFYDDVTTGTVVEQALMAKAEKQLFDRDKCFCDGNPIDPKLTVRYFQKWETSQWETAIREDDIAAIISRSGTATVESVTAEIIDTLTQAEGADDFEKERSLILSTTAMDYSEIIGGTPANMDGLLYVLRDMYNQIRYDTEGYSVMDGKVSTPDEDIRVAISDKLLALLDVTKLANVFNLEKDRIFGKIVPIPVGDLPQTDWYKVIVYDRKRFARYTRKYVYDQSPKQPGQYIKAYLTTIRMYLESELFKAAQIDMTKAAQNILGGLITPNVDPEEPEEDDGGAAVNEQNDGGAVNGG